MNTFLKKARPSVTRAIFSVILLASGTIINILILMFSQTQIDNVLDGGKANFLYIIIALFLGLVFNFGYHFLAYYVINNIESKGILALQNEYYIEITKKQIDFLGDKESGKLINDLNNTIPYIGKFEATLTIYGIEQIIVLILPLIVLFYYNVLLSSIILTILAICFFLSQKVNKKIALLKKDLIRENEKINQHFIQTIDGIDVIKQFKKENYFVRKFRNMSEVIRLFFMKKSTKLESLYICFYTFLSIIVPIMSVILGIYFASIGFMTIGQLIAFYPLLVFLEEPFSTISQLSTVFKQKKIYKDSLKFLFEESNVSTTKKLDKIQKLDINLDYYQFTDGKRVLENTNLEINKNDFLTLTGESGAGKTTLLSILSGIYKTKEKVKVNDFYIEEISEESIRELIVTVFQDSFVFEDSLVNNLTLGETYTDEEIKEVINICQLKEFVDKYGLDRSFFEDGNNISGGERQRISIARALLRKPQVLLLDEITSSLDKNISSKMIEELYNFVKKNDITVIAISHKDDYLKYQNKTYQVVATN